jgi:drug/metabolite transporter (DMT)-like permease
MTAINVAILIVYSLGMSFGQMLFKLAADQTKLDHSSTFIRSLLMSGYFYGAVLLYGILSLIWVWILTRVPLSQAYPFIVLAFVFTPALGVLFFGETLNASYLASLALILSGLGLLVTRASN